MRILPEILCNGVFAVKNRTIGKNEYKKLTAASSASVLVCLTSLVPQDTTCILVMEYIISNMYMEGMAKK